MLAWSLGLLFIVGTHLPEAPPDHSIKQRSTPSPALTDRYVEEIRRTKAVDDFKRLSDLIPKPLTPDERQALLQKAEGAERAQNDRKAFLLTYMDGAYSYKEELEPVENLVAPKWKVQTGDKKRDSAFAYTERVLSDHIRKTPKETSSTLLPLPYPLLIAAPGRFHETYYWDSYFGIKGILSTERVALAQMQIENFLYLLEKFGHVPNGNREYYLTRSQPPFLSSMIKEVYEASLKQTPTRKSHIEAWLKDRAYPLLKLDYEKFWKNPETRFDPKTNLNHPWDKINEPRPERHAFDKEEELGKTYRDVRAAAELGLDFTEVYQKEASKIASVMLNSLLYKTERDLEWAARVLKLKKEEAQYRKAAEKRKEAINKYLWNEKLGRYEPYHLEKKTRIKALNAEVFVPLFVRAASPKQAKAVVKQLEILEKPGGLMASEFTDSPHQWDGTNGWAPFQVMAIEGLLNYGFTDEAKRLANKWVDSIAEVHAQTGAIYERLDVVTRKAPEIDRKKYPVQVGFLWTNGSYVWALLKVLNVSLLPVK